MKIIELVLSGYKRFLLNNITQLTYTPENAFQIILGTNGSGKSSLLYELSPLPAVAKNYIKNGYKRITLTHNGSSYVLESIFSGGSGNHSFTKDGEELNPGNTITVQRDLVEMHFGITQEIHELLIGEKKFTDLGNQQRRDWITKICAVDFTYAVKLFGILKSRARDSQGALKHVKQRITNETNKLKMVSDIKNINDRYESIHSELNLLFRELEGKQDSAIQLQRVVNSTIVEIEQLARHLIITLPIIPSSYSFANIGDIETLLANLKNSKASNDATKTALANQLDEINSLIETLRSTGVDDPDRLKHECLVLKQERYVELRKIQTYREVSVNVESAYGALEEVLEPLLECHNNIPENDNRFYVRSKLLESRELLPGLIKAMETKQNAIAFYTGKIEHLTSLKKEECPKCNYQWVPGLDENRIVGMENKIKQETELLKELTAKRESVETYIEKTEDYLEKFNRFKYITGQYPILKDLWDSLVTDDLLVTNAKLLIPKVFAFREDLDCHYRAYLLTQRINKIEHLLESNFLTGHASNLKDKMDSLEKEIEALTKDSVNLQLEINLVSKLHQKFKEYLQGIDKFNSLVEKLYQLKHSLVKSIRNEILDGVIEKHQNELAYLHSKRSEKSAIENIISDLTVSLGELEKEKELYTLLANELSPTDGLIAEQLKGFIECFVGYVNQIIDNIWTYELKVLPCGIDTSGLNYEFPMEVSNEGVDFTTPDISKGSEAQVELVNMAFKLVIMNYLGLDEYPIYLDEFSKSFDEQHRVNAMTFIKRLIDTGNYSQLFFISHYASQFSLFTQADIVVLDPTNITVPKTYNECIAVR